MSLVYFKRSGEQEKPVALCLSPWQPLPIGEIAQQLGICEASMSVDGVPDMHLSLGELRRCNPGLGSSDNPFCVWGYIGPLATGFRADFKDARGDRPLLGLRVVQQLHLSAATAVYSVVKQNDPSQDTMVLKQVFFDPINTASEHHTLRELTYLRATGRTCPSLPTLLSYGWFLASGGAEGRAGFGDAEAILIKPLGSCVKGKLFTDPQQLCKAGFDIFLALYHLYLVERRHRNVKTENIIYVQQQEQFVLIDFKCALRENDELQANEPPDSLGLVLSLAEMAGWDGHGGNHAAAIVLGKVHNVLASFCYYVFTLPSAWSPPDYKHWLDQLAGACALHACCNSYSFQP